MSYCVLVEFLHSDLCSIEQCMQISGMERPTKLIIRGLSESSITESFCGRIDLFWYKKAVRRLRIYPGDDRWNRRGYSYHGYCRQGNFGGNTSVGFQKTRDIDPRVVKWCTTVCDVDPILGHHHHDQWVNLSSFRHWPDGGLMPDHRLQRWPNIKPPSGHRLVFSVMPVNNWMRHISIIITQHTQNVESMLVYRGSTVYDVGPTVNQHWYNVLCQLGRYPPPLELRWSSVRGGTASSGAASAEMTNQRKDVGEICQQGFFVVRLKGVMCALDQNKHSFIVR